MAEKRENDPVLIKIGKMLKERRLALGRQYKTRAQFIENRSRELFEGQPWISERHLASLERGRNWLSIEKLIEHAYALEMRPEELFLEIFKIYSER